MRHAAVGLPKPDHFGDVDPACLGLRPLPAEERHGLSFAHPDPDGGHDLDELLGEWFNAEFPTWEWEGAAPAARLDPGRRPLHHWLISARTHGPAWGIGP